MHPSPEEAAEALPAARSCPFSPPDNYWRWRETEPVKRVVLPTGREAWAVTRYEDARALLTDTRLSSDLFHPGHPDFNPERAKMPTLLSLDPPEHTRLRRSVIRDFTVRRVASYQSRIQEIVDDQICAMLDGPRPADLVETLALPVPSLVICRLLGVPYADHGFFQSCTARMVDLRASREEREAGKQEIRHYLDELVAGKEAEPPDDLVGRQIRERREAGDYDRAEMVALAFILLLAGHETTANMISLGTCVLLRHPDQLAAITGDPGRTPDAVEEMLRYFSIADTVTMRVATEDIELSGVTIQAGEGVIVLGAAANHDPRMFPSPQEFSIERGARKHVAFGLGMHQCIGQGLARLELRIVFDTLFRRIPTLRLAVPVDDLPFKHDAGIYGLHELPVTW